MTDGRTVKFLTTRIGPDRQNVYYTVKLISMPYLFLVVRKLCTLDRCLFMKM